jgi:hypothetical protein
VTRSLFVLSLLCVAGCGASTPARTPGGSGWTAHPPTEHVTCGAATPLCTDAASLRVRWPDGAHAPDGARFLLDGDPVDAAEAELSVCAVPGTHALRLDGAMPMSIEVVPGAETRVALARGTAGLLTSEVTLGAIDVGATVASLGRGELPTIAYDATPEERRVFGPVLGAAFDAWRARLARVTQLAESQHDAVLRAACDDHEARANAIAVTIAEERPSADRLAAIRRAMATEIEAAGTMIAIERSCPLYAEHDPEATLSSITFEARPYVGTSTAVVRIRVAIDEVEVLDTGAPREAELFDRAVVDGVVPPGEHVVTAEVTFADRGGGHPRRPILPQARITVPSTSTIVLVRALGDGTVEITTP